MKIHEQKYLLIRLLLILLAITTVYFVSPAPIYAGTCASGQSCYNTSSTPGGCSWAGTSCTGGGGYCYTCSACSDGCYSDQLRTGITRDSTGACNVAGPIAYCPGSTTGTCGGNSFVCTSGGWAVPTPIPTATPTPAPMSITAVGFSPDRYPNYQYYDDETIQLGAAVSNSVNSVVWTDNGTNIGVANCSGGNCTNLSWSRGAAVSANESHTFTAYAYNGRSDWWSNPSRSKSLTIISRDVRVTQFTAPSSGASFKYYEDIGVRVFVTTDTTDVRYYDGNATSGVQIGTGTCSAGGCGGISWTNNKTVGTHTIYAYPVRINTVYWNNFLSLPITITNPPAPALSSPVVTPAKVGVGGNLTYTGTLTNASEWRFTIELHYDGTNANYETYDLGYAGSGSGISTSGSVNKTVAPTYATSQAAYIQLGYGKRGLNQAGQAEPITSSVTGSNTSYTVVPLPTVSSVSVNSSGTPQITINGTGFKPTGASKGIVRINGFDIPDGSITDANWNNTTIVMNTPPYAGTVNRVCLGGTDLTSICSNNATPSYKVEPDNTWWNFTATSAYSISGNIFVDTNKNGIKDTGENPYTGSRQRVAIISGPTLPPPYDTSDGTYSFTNLAPGTYTVRYADPFNGFDVPAGYQLTTPASLSVTIGPNATNINFGISNLFTWFQGVKGDMRIDAGFVDKVPSSAQYPRALLNSENDSQGGTHGILFSGSQSYDFCSGGITGGCIANALRDPHWIVGGATNSETFTPSTPGTVAASYDYLSSTANQSGSTSTTDLSTICTPSNCTLPGSLANGAYKANGDVTLNAYDFPPSKNYVFLVNGNLTIKGKITVPVGSTVTFAASRDIHIDKGVGETTASSTTTNLEGFYSAGNNFIIEGGGSSSCPAGDRRLNIAGSIIVNAKLSGGLLQNQRDLCSNDITYPSLYIAERPDFIINSPDFIKQPNFIWQEVAP